MKKSRGGPLGIVISSVSYCFLLFGTDAIYDVDVAGYYTMADDVIKPVSVADIIRQKITSDSNQPAEVIGETGVNQGGSSSNPPGTSSDPGNGNAPSSDVSTAGGGQLVDSVRGIGIYDGPTVSGSGRFVDVRPAMQSHNEPLTKWYTRCHTNVNQASDWAKNHAQGTHTKDGVLVDGTDRALVGVGPAVINPNRTTGSLDSPTADEMQYGTVIDVVVEKNGEEFYIPCVVVECKAHSYPTWIAQSGYATKNGNIYFTESGHRDNYSTPSNYDASKAESWDNCVVEFLATNDTINGLSSYPIKGIIVY